MKRDNLKSSDLVVNDMYAAHVAAKLRRAERRARKLSMKCPDDADSADLHMLIVKTQQVVHCDAA